ncbi:hypothetical protein KR093_007128 [Drosophila rubida]|uniref:RNA/RNP complex-1-interacting phosphatase n=1 Tax=Drosophila rubida TaxID=30044 RepID=A0AAD4K869_9MUSC|nr:hypothetical protein KR093_007128 [Drosophila rubida]
MGKAIPDRWLDYQPIGQRVPSTRFIAFKVPLRQNINETVDEERRLAPNSLLESVPNLGLIVDLTNTDRYYNPQTFKDQKVEHQKLMIPGHHTPSRALSQRFCEYVTNFLEANADNDKLIGVHCTHGVNRTGYLICYFMITKMNMAPKLAIQTFADARGHQIERDNYTSSLMQLRAAGAAEKTNQGWPRQFKKTKEDQHSDLSSGSWRHDQISWQQHLEQDKLQRQLREEKQQHKQQQRQRIQNQQQDRYYVKLERGQQQQRQDNDQDRSYGRRERRQQPPPPQQQHQNRQREHAYQQQQSWRGNEFMRFAPYTRKHSYNVSLNEKLNNCQTPRSRPNWQRDPNDYDWHQGQSCRSHNNNNNNYSDRNYSRNNSYRSYNNYNRHEQRPVHIRFDDE